MKSAVEWFAGEIKGGKLITNQKFEELLQQANKMFEQQIIDAYHEAYPYNIMGYNPANQYYNETFKNK